MSAKPARPERILYGLDELQESFCFLDEGYARVLDAEVQAVKQLTTIGEAMELNARLKHTYVPGAPDDEAQREAEELELDSPYDWSESMPVQQGDWPPMVTALSKGTFAPNDEEAWQAIFSPEVGGRIVWTAFNGECLEIPPENEAALLAVFKQLGVAFVRDDAFIGNFSGY